MLTLVPVAAPIFGVVRTAPALTLMLPDPSNAVVVLSTLVLITVPAILIPAPVLAVYAWLELKILNVILEVPKVITPAGALRIKAVPALTLPLVVKK